MNGLPTISEQKQYWDERWRETDTPSSWSLRRAEKIISVLKLDKQRSLEILDIGCGTGWFTALLNAFGNATGIDLSETSIAIAKEKYPNIDYISGNLYELCLKKNFYDIVVAQEVIPHVEDQIRFIAILNSILKSNGILVITMLNKFVVNRIERDHGPRSHIINWLSVRDLKNLLNPNFRTICQTSVVCKKGTGILRIINSTKLKKVFHFFGVAGAYESLMEKLGAGLFRIIVVHKK